MHKNNEILPNVLLCILNLTHISARSVRFNIGKIWLLLNQRCTNISVVVWSGEVSAVFCWEMATTAKCKYLICSQLYLWGVIFVIWGNITFKQKKSACHHTHYPILVYYFINVEFANSLCFDDYVNSTSYHNFAYAVFFAINLQCWFIYTYDGYEILEH